METNVVIALFIGIVIAVFVSTATIFFVFRQRYRNLAKQIDEQEVASHQISQFAESPVRIYDTIGFVPPAKAVGYVHRGFIEDELREALLKEGVASIVGLHGLGGIGKTELAKHIVEELRDNFEGVLWVDVGVKTPQQVVTDMLIKCGIQLPPEVPYQNQRDELYNFLRNHRFLVVLDDIRIESVNGLGDFLPPNPNSVLITSRIQQIGGIGKSLILESMTLDQSLELMEAILGKEIIDLEKDEAIILVERCGYIPLAIEIAARRIRQIQGMEKPIAHYLEKTKQYFSELRMSGDPRWNMSAVFDISYQELSTSDQKRFRVLAAFAPAGFTPESVMAVWDDSNEATISALSRFINLSLIKVVEGSVERYRLHDLLYEYATSKFLDRSEQDSALKSLAEWLLKIFDENYVPHIENQQRIIPERDNLLKLAEWAHSQKQGRLLALLTTKTRNWFYANFTDDWQNWIFWLEASLQFGIEDKQLNANVLRTIGDVQQFRDDRDAALVSYNEALKLFNGIGDKLGEANVLQAIGDVQQFHDEREAALESYNEALNLFKVVGDLLGEANVLQAIGDVQQFRKENDAALVSYNEALKLFKAVGAKLGEANVRKAIGDVQQFRDEREAALESYNEALKLFKAVGAKLGEANVLQAIGDVQQFRKENDAALVSYYEALKLFKAVGDRLGEANVLQAIGDVQQFRKEMDAALASYNEALKLFKEIGAKLGEANVLKAIGDLQQFRKEIDAALVSYKEALNLFKEIGAILGEANALKAIGDLQQFRKENDAALVSYSEALKLFKAIGAKLGEANVLQAIGDVQYFRDELDAALESYYNALRLFETIGDRLGEANTHLSLGNIKRQQKDIVGAKDAFQFALSIYQTIGDLYSQGRALYRLGDCATDKNDQTNALSYYQEAKEIWKKIGIEDLVEQILQPRIDTSLAERMNKAVDSTST